MDKEICDYYEPIGRKDRLCKHFIGDRENRKQVARCRHYCSIIDCKECMQERSYKRVNGALRQK